MFKTLLTKRGTSKKTKRYKAVRCGSVSVGAATDNHRTSVAGVFFCDVTEADVGVAVAVVGLLEDFAHG